MSLTRVGLMGFGRIGRNLFRILYKGEDIQIGAISDIADHKALEYLLRFDTILGPFPDEVSVKDGHLYVVGRQIPMLSEAEPGNVPWGDLGVDTVIEATAQHRTREELERHLENGAKRVILCVPQKTPPDITVVMGVNDDRVKPEHRIVSNASCTAHCAAPILKILHAAFGVQRVFLSTVHAYTNQQRLADVPSEDKRRGRAAAENIIPQETNSAQVITELLPELAGRITGESMNVPVPDGSIVDLVCRLSTPASRDEVNNAVREAAAGPMQKIVEYSEAPLVSSDIIGNPHSSIFDALSTKSENDGYIRILSWYDNEWGYSNRVVDLIGMLAAITG